MSPTRLALTAVLLTALTGTLPAQLYPLGASSGSTTAVASTAPFLIPEGLTQTRLFDRNALNALGLPSSMSNWDMITYDPSSRYVFVPAEVASGGGVFRYDTLTAQLTVIMHGNGMGAAAREANPANFVASTDEFSRTDGCTWTSWGTIVTGEETTGGRLFEILNPLDPTGPFNVVWRSQVPAMAHEGIRCDDAGSLYVIDEDQSGSICRFVPTVPGDLSQGQTFVLVVDAYTGPASQSWSSTANAASIRTGSATWVPMTDPTGQPLTTANPFAYVSTTGGRTAADELGGTPYGRPEDLSFGRLANGHEVLYFSATSEHAVYGVELVSSTSAFVRVFLDRNTIDRATGAAVGTAFASPDNLEFDLQGDLYVVEDENPGDVWKCRDLDGDGVAEDMGRFISLGVGGSEPTGIIFDPNDPFAFIISVQHPTGGNDTIWRMKTDPFPGTGDDLELAAGVGGPARLGPGEFVQAAAPQDLVAFDIRSPGGDFQGRLYYFFFGLYPTGMRPNTGLPFLFVDLATAVPLVNAQPSFFPALLPAGGAPYLAAAPAGLAGFSAMFQAAALGPLAANGVVAVSNGQEIVFVP